MIAETPAPTPAPTLTETLPPKSRKRNIEDTMKDLIAATDERDAEKKAKKATPLLAYALQCPHATHVFHPCQALHIHITHVRVIPMSQAKEVAATADLKRAEACSGSQARTTLDQRYYRLFRRYNRYDALARQRRRR